MKAYDHSAIEKKWQKTWTKSGIYKTNEDKTLKGNVKGGEKSTQKPKAYILDMFPYPSGAGLHVGHPRGYIATDVYSRYKKMNGYNILHPMGWDAFGLPAEEFAIKNKIHPAIATEKNVQRYKEQLSILGLNYDWSREVNTTDPEYYKWTQWAFLQMHKKGLTYESHEPINWCPSCKTGLANEDLNADGTCERCGSLVEKKPIRQWVIKITQYADRLLKDLDNLNWPESIKESQRNWIGRSEGALVDFKVNEISNEKISVFTTRIDTIFSGTFIVLAPEHAFIEKHKDLIENYNDIVAYRKKTESIPEMDRLADKYAKDGVELKGITVTNPATGEKMPVWIANFVLAQYGTGAVFADAHDKRDFDLAKKYNIPLKVSLKPENVLDDEFTQIQNLEVCYEGEGVLINSKEFTGLTSAMARPKIIDWLSKQGLAQRKVNYKLRDWVFSRQRYWGEPIPLIHCEKCGVVPVPEKELPLKLPNVKSYEPTGTGESPLATITKWVNTKCPNCKGKAKRETNTMPQWAGSCWYYLRYIDPKKQKSFS
jgi:leucyl-tRNA synthetase